MILDIKNYKDILCECELFKTKQKLDKEKKNY